MIHNNKNNNFSLNLKQQLFSNNLNNNNKSVNIGNNLNLNFGKLSNNFDIQGQVTIKFIMKFYEKLNLNNKSNKGLKYSNMNDLTNTLNKNKINNIKKHQNKYIIKINN